MNNSTNNPIYPNYNTNYSAWPNNPNNIYQTPQGNINHSTINSQLEALFEQRKKIIGNNFINIVWLENPYLDFDPNIILSQVILMYIVIYPYSDKNFLIKFKFNKNSKIKIKEKLLNYFTDELLINPEFITQFLINKIILINLMIKYIFDNQYYKRLELDLHFNNIPDNNPNKVYYDTNLSSRYQIIKNIVNKNF